MNTYVSKRTEYQVHVDASNTLVQDTELFAKQCAAIAAQAEIVKFLTDEKLTANKVSLRSSLQKVQAKLRTFKVESSLLPNALEAKFKLGLTLQFRP